jgi:multiple sugar transport system permease protein
MSNDRTTSLHKLHKTSKKLAWSSIRLFVLIGLSFMILYPVYKMFASAFMSKLDMLDSSVFLIPKNFSVYSFLVSSRIIGYLESFGNSLTLSLTISLIQIATCTLVGYGFARFHFPFKKILFALVIFTFVVPPQLYMSSLFIRFKFFDLFGLFQLLNGKPLNLIDASYTPLYLLSLTGNGIKNGLFIYIFRQGFRNLPKELEEAAYVDGAGVFHVFSRIMLPNLTAIIITVGLFSMVWQYNDTFYSGFLLRSPNLLVLQYNILYHWDVRYLPNYGLSDAEIYNPVFATSVRSAAALIIIAPIVGIYMSVQRYFTESLERSGITG